MARIYHPDRITDIAEKSIAQEKFSIIHQAYSILSNSQERKRYDDGCNVPFSMATKTSEWEQFLKPSTNNDMNNARFSYQNSFDEQCDVEREFCAGKGSMTHILNNIPFMRTEDQPRIVEIIKKSIDEGRIPDIKIKKLKK